MVAPLVSLVQLAFFPEFLLRLFQNAVIDDSIESKFLVDEAGANVFVQHNLGAIYRDGKVDCITWYKKIVGSVDDVGLASESRGVAGFNRLLLVRLAGLHCTHD